MDEGGDDGNMGMEVVCGGGLRVEKRVELWKKLPPLKFDGGGYW